MPVKRVTPKHIQMGMKKRRGKGGRSLARKSVTPASKADIRQKTIDKAFTMKKGGSMKKKGMAKGGPMKKKGMKKGGKLKMVTNDQGQRVPFFAADGVGKSAKGGMMKKKGYAMGGAMKKKGMAGGGAMKKKGMKKGGMMKKGYAKGGKVTNVASLRKIAKDMGYTIAKAAGGMMKKKGMKKGGVMKRSKGGTVRGAGAATRGKKFGRAG